jgi:ferredoxin
VPAVTAYKVQLQHSGGVSELEVEDGEYILQVALDQGIEVPHDCKMGVCMNCASRLVRVAGGRRRLRVCMLVLSQQLEWPSGSCCMRV